ncbi:hypothetical protein HPB48_016512 [Haemaphysalis longicornis]|uniref:Uncharacterized protein n=1 Tax=Haemaphysalis longicornis TaxID=44386 RepID=A0A9J6H4S8_HAELO|nr:hypothetical protein HPB48_016512 [Haemaphysalis longicornis]
MACGNWIGTRGEAGLFHRYMLNSSGWLPGHAAGRVASRPLVDVHNVSADEPHDTASEEDAAGSAITKCLNIAHHSFRACLRSYRHQKGDVVSAPQDAPQPSSRRRQPIGHHPHLQRERHQKRRASVRRDDDGEVVHAGGGFTAKLPAVCAGVVAVLCYLNSLDGQFVHDDMVAIVGNPDVTGEHRTRSSHRSSSLWMNDFWGRAMADVQSHKSYRPLTVLSFR